MDIFLNPNIVYLLLVVGIFTTILALFAPGTGLLELGALIVMLFAGWGIYNNIASINGWALIVLALGVVPFVLAMRKRRDVIFLIVAIAAFELGSVYLFKPEAWWKPAINPILAGVTILLTGVFLWIAGSKVIEAELRPPTHSLDTLIGQVGEAKTTIHAEGTAQVAGEQWSARSDELIPMGMSVRVVQMDGFILKVEKA